MMVTKELFNVNMEVIPHGPEDGWDFMIRLYKRRTVAKFFVWVAEVGDYINIGCLEHHKRYIPVALEYIINRYPTAMIEHD